MLALLAKYLLIHAQVIFAQLAVLANAYRTLFNTHVYVQSATAVSIVINKFQLAKAIHA